MADPLHLRHGRSASAVRAFVRGRHAGGGEIFGGALFVTLLVVHARRILPEAHEEREDLPALYSS
ncbi:MAG: hypothetical protein ABIR38_00100 [Chthoniobacterales bacterium]